MPWRSLGKLEGRLLGGVCPPPSSCDYPSATCADKVVAKNEAGETILHGIFGYDRIEDHEEWRKHPEIKKAAEAFAKLADLGIGLAPAMDVAGVGNEMGYFHVQFEKFEWISMHDFDAAIEFPAERKEWNDELDKHTSQWLGRQYAFWIGAIYAATGR